MAQSDYQSFPVGGVTTFVRTITPHIDMPLVAIGVTRDHGCAGHGTIRLAHRSLPFYSVGRLMDRSPVPLRVQASVLTLTRRQQLLDLDPDVYYIHSPDMGLTLPLGHSIPRAYQLHGASLTTASSPHRYLRNPVGARVFSNLVTWNVRHAALVLGVNEECRRLAEKLGRPYLHVPPAVDTEFFTVPTRERSERQRLVCISRLDDNKNVGFAVDVLLMLVRMDFDATLTVGGDGEALHRLMAKVRNLGLSERVTFLGAVDPSGVRDAFAQADVFILPSSYEGLPTALLEAMACQCAVVARNLPGVRSVITHGANGLLFDGSDARQVADLVLHAWRSRGSLGAKARATVVAEYGAAAAGRRLTAALRELVPE